jgi:hypothetical protein
MLAIPPRFAGGWQVIEDSEAAQARRRAKIQELYTTSSFRRRLASSRHRRRSASMIFSRAVCPTYFDNAAAYAGSGYTFNPSLPQPAFSNCIGFMNSAPTGHGIEPIAIPSCAVNFIAYAAAAPGTLSEHESQWRDDLYRLPLRLFLHHGSVRFQRDSEGSRTLRRQNGFTRASHRGGQTTKGDRLSYG